MDFTNNPRNVTPGRAVPGGPLRPMPERRVFSDFTTRPIAPRPHAAPQPVPVTRPAQPAAPAPQPPRPVQLPATPQQPHPAHPQTPPQPASRPVPAVTPAPPPAAPRPFGAAPSKPVPHHTAAPASSALVAPPPPPVPHKEPKTPKPHGHNAHSGLVGFVFFVVFAALVLSPLIPGKILSNFPGSSQSESSGDQSLACLHDVQNIATTTRYDIKVGSPITYKYSTTTTQKATCDDKEQTAVGGHTAQFNPLGLAIDIGIALVLAIGIARIWRLIFAKKD